MYRNKLDQFILFYLIHVQLIGSHIVTYWFFLDALSSTGLRDVSSEERRFINRQTRESAVNFQITITHVYVSMRAINLLSELNSYLIYFTVLLLLVAFAIS